MTAGSRLRFAALALCAAFAPGCCGRCERADSGRSLAFFGRTVSYQAGLDAAATYDTVTGVPAAVGRQFHQAGADLERACELYYGR